jgi:hypothetical protein
MALLTAYLARTAQRHSRRTTVTATRSFFGRVAAYFRAAGSALSEAQELRRAMTRKYPFMDV